MRRPLPAVLLAILALALSSAGADKSANKTIDRYRKASGGDAVNRVKSTSMTGSVKAADGSTGRFSYHTSLPSSLRMDLEAGSSKISECYNGKSAWRTDGRGLRTLLGDEAKRLRLESLMANNRLRELQKARIVPQAAGKGAIDGRDANVVELIKDSVRVKLFFDASTGLILKRERETADGTEEVFYSDYRAIDRVMEPFSMRIKRGVAEFAIMIEKVEHNRPPDLAAFRYPQVEGAHHLPNLETLMKSIIANQEKVEELREHYTCRLTEVERKLDGDGRVKSSETKVYEVTPIGDDAVERLINVNGKDLAASEQEKEDKRVQKQVEELIKRHEKETQKKEQRRERGEKDKDDDDITILDFLRISEITSVRREMFRGHEVIAFDFEPRKGFKAKNRAEDIINKLAGTIWVDEAAQQIARLEARLTDSFKIGGGMLASIGSSTAFAFEQRRSTASCGCPRSEKLTSRRECCCLQSSTGAWSGATATTRSIRLTANTIWPSQRKRNHRPGFAAGHAAQNQCPATRCGTNPATCCKPARAGNLGCPYGDFEVVQAFKDFSLIGPHLKGILVQRRDFVAEFVEALHDFVAQRRNLILDATHDLFSQRRDLTFQSSGLIFQSSGKSPYFLGKPDFDFADSFHQGGRGGLRYEIITISAHFRLLRPPSHGIKALRTCQLEKHDTLIPEPALLDSVQIPLLKFATSKMLSESS